MWKSLTTDNWIISVILGKIIELEELPVQPYIPSPLQLSLTDSKALNSALAQFVKQKIVELCEPIQEDTFYSNVFSIIIRDGSVRVILNLRELNHRIEHIHFKMDTMYYQRCVTSGVSRLLFLHC